MELSESSGGGTLHVMNKTLHDSFRTYAVIIFLRLLLDMSSELKVILEGAARYRNKFHPYLQGVLPGVLC